MRAEGGETYPGCAAVPAASELLSSECLHSETGEEARSADFAGGAGGLDADGKAASSMPCTATCDRLSRRRPRRLKSLPSGFPPGALLLVLVAAAAAVSPGPLSVLVVGVVGAVVGSESPLEVTSSKK